jgi:hypothetical protein
MVAEHGVAAVWLPKQQGLADLPCANGSMVVDAGCEGRRG